MITESGEQKGIVTIEEAKEFANDANLDLVEISPNTKPPVCKILDFGKYRFERQKKKKLNKKKKYTKFIKHFKKQKKTISEQSQDELEPIISTPINSPMSDE